MSDMDDIQDEVDEALRELLPFEPDREAREQGMDRPPEEEEPDIDELDALVLGDMDQFGVTMEDIELGLEDEL